MGSLKDFVGDLPKILIEGQRWRQMKKNEVVPL
jgi:hypothetical protein